MLSDEGEYPEGMVAGEHFIAYTSAEDAAGKAERLLAEPEGARAIGRKAALMVASLYSKHQQWTRFQELVGSL
jgi:spore maturation protein CgeB